jgi:transposase
MLRRISPLLAQSGHSKCPNQCPLSEAKRTSRTLLVMSANGPNRTMRWLSICTLTSAKLAENYLAFIQLASTRLWLRVNESHPSST